MRAFRPLMILSFALLLGACAHPVTINPIDTPARNTALLSPKKVAYVMTDTDRNKQVTTDGGGGDKINYFPYRDLEKGIRDTLRAVYTDVSVIGFPTDMKSIQENSLSFVFAPEIYTSSKSESAFTWPPTQFTVELSCTVTDSDGKIISRIRVIGNGSAEFSEFKTDFGLAGRRAAAEASAKLKQEISNNPLLH